MNGLPNMYTPQDIRKYLHISSQSAYNLFKRRDFPSIKMGNKNIISEADFINWLNKEKKIQNELRYKYEK